MSEPTIIMMKRELPRTMGDMNYKLLYKDICQAAKEYEKLQSQNAKLIEALEESYALNVNVFSEAEREMLCYYSEYKAVIVLAATALKEAQYEHMP